MKIQGGQTFSHFGEDNAWCRKCFAYRNETQWKTSLEKKTAGKRKGAEKRSEGESRVDEGCVVSRRREG